MRSQCYSQGLLGPLGFICLLIIMNLGCLKAMGSLDNRRERFMDGQLTLMATGGHYIGKAGVLKLLAELIDLGKEIYGPNSGVEFERELLDLGHEDEEKCLDANIFERFTFMMRKFPSARANLIPYLRESLQEQTEACRENLSILMVQAINRMTQATVYNMEKLRTYIGRTGIYLAKMPLDIPINKFVAGTLPYFKGKLIRLRRQKNLLDSEQFFDDKFKRLEKDCRVVVHHMGPIVRVYEDLGADKEPEFNFLKDYMVLWRPNVIICNNLLNRPALRQELAKSFITLVTPARETPLDYSYDFSTIHDGKDHDDD